MEYILKNLPKIALIAYVIATSLALLTLKISTLSGAHIGFSGESFVVAINFYTVCGIILYGLSFLIYTYLLSQFSLGYLVPITTALVYTVVFIASFVLFHEIFTVAKLAGITFVFLGLVLLNNKA